MVWMPELSERRQRQLLGVLLVALAGLLIASLGSYRVPVPGARPWAEANASGPLGAWAAHALFGLFGRLAAWGVPVLALAFGWNRLRGRPLRPIAVRAGVIGALTLQGLALGGLGGLAALPWVGTVGLGLAGATQAVLGTVGGAIALGALLLGTGLVASELGFHALSLAWAYLVRDPLRAAGESARQALAEWRRRREAMPAGAAAAGGEAAAPRRRNGAAAAAPAPSALRIVTPDNGDEETEASRARRRKSRPPAEQPAAEPAAGRLPATTPATGTRAAAAGALEEKPAGGASRPAPGAPRPSGAAVPAAVAHTGDLPGLELLERNPNTGLSVSEEELRSEAEHLTARLGDFGIRGAVTEVHPGPVITTFEFTPAPGVKVSQITSREDDLALAMRASRIRIVAPIPGKGAVGVEIPNRSPRAVYLREVLASDAYRRHPAALKVALGVDVNGNPVAADLTTMPHLLVAGSTGSGKSVYLNVLIASLLFGNGPDRLRLLMIDPKMIELTGYDGIPHLLMPVVTDAKRAARSLRWAVGEMERRYKLLAACGARNIGGFNRKLEQSEPPKGPEGEPLEPMPYVVVIVDELADLMLTMPAEMEEPVGRLAQMARAVGIHLVLATQRPSVDVLTGVIKANFPSRIAFQVSSKTDSRTILDMNGAEKLLGRGDMLWLPSGMPEPLRVHGPFMSENESGRLADSWRERAPAGEAPAGIEEAVERAVEQSDDEDQLVPDAVRLVVLHQQGSTSLLQRRLKVGYSRASRLMDHLEGLGVVGPFMGSKARDVLVDETYLEEHNIR